MKITISSLPGAGSSTAARLLAKQLNIPRIDAGEIWDAIAAERGLDVLGLNLAAEKDKSIDVALDEKMLEYARAPGDRLLEARLIGWLCAQHHIDALKVWVECPLPIRAARVAAREHADLTTMIGETETRETSEAKRYKMFYDIDMHDLSIYDLVIDSSQRAPEAIVDAVVAQLGMRRSAMH